MTCLKNTCECLVRADCWHLSTKKPQPVVSGVSWHCRSHCWFVLFVKRLFKLMYYVIWWLHPWVRKTKKPRNLCEDQKTYAFPPLPPPLPLQKIRSSLILNLVLSRTVRKCFKKMSRTWHAKWTTKRKGKGLFCSNRLYFFHLFVLLFSTRQASNRF